MSSQHHRPQGYFVTGTGTDVGKTLVCALLTRVLDADYWKPLQTGLEDHDDDTSTIARLTGLPSHRFHKPAVEFQAARSPLSAARCENREIDLDCVECPSTARPLIVEGAGGLMVPITPEACMIDLIARLQLPTILVVRTGLGAINQTLLSIGALRQHDCPLAGIIMNGRPHADDADAIQHFGKTPILATIPELEALSPSVIDAAASQLSDERLPVLQANMSR